MRGGRLRHLVSIEQPSESQDAAGEVTASWSEFASVRASVEPVSGKEYFDAHQVIGEQMTRVRIRYLSGVTEKMRVSWDSRIFDIESVINTNERNRETILMCKEIK